jgi:hypothetical protein
LEKQTLQVVLMPGQTVFTKEKALLYCSENLQQKERPEGLLRRICIKRRNPKYRKVELTNDTSTIGYAGLHNSLDVTKNMIIKESYVLAHTGNVCIEPFMQTDVNN